MTSQDPSIFSERYQGLISTTIQERLDKAGSPFSETHLYHLGLDQPTDKLRGKFLRPVLVFMASEAVGGSTERTKSVALAIEMIHNFSLIHDDIEDGDQYRRHRLTVWAKWGEMKALISGNAMLKVADLTIADMVRDGIPLGRALQIQHLLTEACLQMIEGQHTDIGYEEAFPISETQYLEMVDRKTGSLITAALVAGVTASITDHQPNTAQHFSELGQCLGRLFQIRDDILGAWATSDSGKPVGTDIRRKKNALPLIHLLSKADVTQRTQAMELLQQSPEVDDSTVANILKLMESSGTKQWCQEQCTNYRNQAHAIIGNLQIGDSAKQGFQDLADYMLERVK